MNPPYQLDSFHEADLEYRLSEADALIGDLQSKFQSKFGSNVVQNACLYSDNTASRSEDSLEDHFLSPSRILIPIDIKYYNMWAIVHPQKSR